jgi:hypothetical protein
MDARSELLTYMGAALGTIAVLFGLQIWYATYLDTHVVNVHPLDAPADAKVAERRAQEQAKLSGGKMPIARAKELLVSRGRSSYPTIVPKASEDLSAMSGWMHRPGFKPYVPRKAAATAQPQAAATGELGAAEQAAPEQQVAAAEAAPAPAAEPAPARAPVPQRVRAQTPTPAPQLAPAAPQAAPH